jgi:signal transduction histidine kinase
VGRGARDVKRLLERIELGVVEQRRFAANASHELRTPLSEITTSLEVARRRPRDAAHWERVADAALASVRRMAALLDKLLALSRAGAPGLAREVVELRGLVAAAVERAVDRAAQRDVALHVEPGGDVLADVDPDAIAIVLDNLLRNAIDHSPPRAAVELAVDAAPRPRIAIADRGPGVPEDRRHRIFEPFGGHHQSDRAAGGGLGLGLAICKRIVENHGGAIGVEARAGGGARFVVELPATRAVE